MSIQKEFIDVTTARLALVNQGGLGVFELLCSTSEPSSYSFVLRLDIYQSNCNRLWLEYRWLFKSLVGAQIELLDGPSLLVSLSKCFGTEQRAHAEFAVWQQLLVDEFKRASGDRA